MRTDVKLGVAFALVMVLAAGGYFMFRGDKQKPISLADTTTPDAKTLPSKPATAPPKPATTNPNRPVIKPSLPGSNSGTALRPVAPATTTTPTINKPVAPQPASGMADNSAPTTPRPAAPSSVNPPTTGAETTSPSVAGNTAPSSNPSANPSERPANTATSPSITPSAPGPVVAERPTTPTTGSPLGLTGIPNASQSSTPPGRTSNGLAPLSNSPSSTVTTIPASPPASSNPASPIPPGIKSITPPKAETASNKTGAADAAVDTHKVQAGDSLSSLAQAYYGDSKYARVLADANPKITDPGHLKVGTLVNIPSLSPDAASKFGNGNATAAKPGEKNADGKRTYTVKAGDSFYSIAKSQLGSASRWKELLALNNAVVKGDPTSLQPGQRLVLPESH